MPEYGSGLAPYFMALALWVGALAFYLMSAPLSERLLAARRPAWVIALRSYLPGALMAVAQGVLAALVIRFGVGVEMAQLPVLMGIAVLTSLTFVAINQALIALLDAPGRFLALLLIVLQLSSAGGTYPIETAPAFFQGRARSAAADLHGRGVPLPDRGRQHRRRERRAGAPRSGWSAPSPSPCWPPPAAAAA